MNDFCVYIETTYCLNNKKITIVMFGWAVFVIYIIVTFVLWCAAPDTDIFLMYYVIESLIAMAIMAVAYQEK